MKDNIILFDGYCNLCGFWVNWVKKRDKKKQFKFVPLQSGKAAKILQSFPVENKRMRSVILISGKQYYEKSTACLKILKQISAPLKILSVILIIPAPLRDIVYDIIAGSRYKIFGRRESCRIMEDDRPNELPDL